MKLRSELPAPTPAELEILGVLWRSPGVTVREIHDAMSGKSTGYTTALKTLQIMTEKGLVTREPVGRAHKYYAAVAEAKVQSNLVTDLLDRAFGGAARNLVLRALSEHKSTPEELAEIRSLLDRLEEESK